MNNLNANVQRILDDFTNRGKSLNAQGRFDEAESCLRKSLEIDPDNTEALYALGITLASTGRTEEAEVHQQRILNMNADHIGALLLLGDFASANGKFSNAESFYRRVLLIDPESAPAMAALVGLRKMTSDDKSWLKSAEALLQKGLTPHDESQLCFAIGKYCDDVGDFKKAFFNFSRANELFKACSGTVFDRQAMSRSIDSLIQIYNHSRISPQNEGASDSSRPVFIVGMPRTGSTLIEQIIASHPNAFGAGELTFWDSAAKILSVAELQSSTSSPLVKELIDEYLRHLSGFSTDATRVVDKMPVNFAYIGLIHSVFPKAKIIHSKRHPIDTCLSIYVQKFTPNHTYSYDMDDLVHYFREYNRLMAHWHSVLPRNTLLAACLTSHKIHQQLGLAGRV